MKRSRSIGWFVRITILLSIFLWVYTLHRWSQRGDPRFYRFVSTDAGRVLARVFSWHGALPDIPIAEKTEDEMSAGELQVKRAMERDVASGLPTHRLEFNDGDEMFGRIVDYTPESLTFSENYGESGEASVTVPRSTVSALETLTNEPPAISYRDVRFSMEFPGMNFYKRSPYSIVTDESYFRVEHIVENLMRLYRQFVLEFEDLFTESDRAKGIQVLFFSDEARYREYQQKYAPHMDGSAGFYSPWADRLVVYNQGTARHVAKVRRELAEEEAQHREAYSNQPRVLARLDAWKQETERRISRFAEQQTMSTIRHEGSHQLFFSYGVHSINRIENEWLFEGLAAYAETPRIGDKDPVRVKTLREALEKNRLIPIAMIVNLRSDGGLMSLEDPRDVELGYAEAWSLVRFLLEPDWREGFFEYIAYVRDSANFKEVHDTPSMDLLCHFLGLTPDELSAKWRSYVAAL